MNKNSFLYEKDFYAWAMHNAQLLRQGKLKEIDVDNIAEEMESMSGREKRELINRLVVLIAHLLKWQFQPIRRSKSWKFTINEQRTQVNDIIEQSPSLKNEIKNKFDIAYERAIRSAEAKTAIPEKNFPKKCPYTLEQCLDYEFFPE